MYSVTDCTVIIIVILATAFKGILQHHDGELAGPGCAQNIRDWFEMCAMCATRSHQPQMRRALLQTVDARYLIEVAAMTIMGTLLQWSKATSTHCTPSAHKCSYICLHESIAIDKTVIWEILDWICVNWTKTSLCFKNCPIQHNVWSDPWH